MTSNAQQNGPSLAPLDLRQDPFGRLLYTGADGAAHIVVPVRAFPITAPRYGVALCDPHGRELVWIDDLETQPPPVRRLLEEELARHEFLPVLRRIVKASSVVLPAEWEVETDRGPTRLVLDSEDNIHPLEDGRALLTDAQGLRYLLPDPTTLDGHTRSILERYL